MLVLSTSSRMFNAGLNKFKEAKVECEKAIQANENDAEAYRVLASIHTELEEFDEAVGRLRRANELRPGNIFVVLMSSFPYVIMVLSCLW